MIFGRTNLKIGQSKAKNCEESAGDVRFDVAPRKPSKNMEKRVFGTEKILKKIWRRKMKCWESPETRFYKVSRRTEPSLRVKRSFEVVGIPFFLATGGTMQWTDADAPFVEEQEQLQIVRVTLILCRAANRGL